MTVNQDYSSVWPDRASRGETATGSPIGRTRSFSVCDPPASEALGLIAEILAIQEAFIAGQEELIASLDELSESPGGVRIRRTRDGTR